MTMKLFGAAVAACLSCTTQAATWTPSGEHGLVATSGTSDTLNVNGKLALHGEDATWLHDYAALALRNETNDQATANRFEFGGRTGYRFSERSYLLGALRYENDDFSPYQSQTVASVGFGWFARKDDRTTWLFEAGPGFRWADLASSGETQNDAVLRARMDFKHALTASTTLIDTLGVEAGSDNTFVQNDVGVQVAINSTLALKAGFQVRHNTDVAHGVDKTDTLMLVNLVWSAPPAK